MEPYIAAMTTPTPRSLPFEVVEADIGAYALEHGPWLAVVSSDDSYLSHGGGSSRSVWNAARLDGDALPSRLPLALGSIVATAPGRLGACAILHAVTLELDTQTRVDAQQCEQLFQDLASTLESLATRTAHRHVLLPLIGTGAAGLGEGVVAELIAEMAALLEPSKIRLTIPVPRGARRVHERICTGFGIVDTQVDLPQYLEALPEEPAERFSRCYSALEVVLGTLQAGGTGPGSRSLGALWTNAKARLERLPRHDVPWGALQFMPAVIEFRNSVAHGSRPKQQAAIAANMTETALRGVLQVVESGLIPGVDRQLVSAALRTGAAQASTILRRRWYHTWDLSGEARRIGDSHASDSAADGRLRALSDLLDSLQRTQDDRGKALAALGGWPASSIQRDRSPTSAHLVESSHVRRLAKLLAELPEDERAHLREKLDEMGYRGDDSKRFIEYCTREDPPQILDELGARRLRTLLKNLGIETRASDTMPDLRDRLLRELGFRSAAPLAGLQPALDELTKHRKAVPIADSTSIHGMVVKGSGRFERTIRDLLRFMCNYLFKRGPEEHFKDHLNGGASRDFGKATLGTLLHCLELLAKEIEKCARSGEQDTDGTPPLLELQGPLSATRLAPKGVEGLSRLRNLFAHFEKEHGEQHDRERAREFFDGAIEVLEHWMSADPPIYPKIIVVERLSVDRWNRRTIETRTDAGEEEILICDDDLKPGDVYFMYPLSNPMRVDPILMRFEPDAPVEHTAPGS